MILKCNGDFGDNKILLFYCYFLVIAHVPAGRGVWVARVPSGMAAIRKNSGGTRLRTLPAETN